jgi:hypothetical protein
MTLLHDAQIGQLHPAAWRPIRPSGDFFDGWRIRAGSARHENESQENNEGDRHGEPPEQGGNG